MNRKAVALPPSLLLLLLLLLLCCVAGDLLRLLRLLRLLLGETHTGTRDVRWIGVLCGGG